MRPILPSAPQGPRGNGKPKFAIDNFAMSDSDQDEPVNANNSAQVFRMDSQGKNYGDYNLLHKQSD